MLGFQTHTSCSTSHQIRHLFQLYASVNIDGQWNAFLLHTNLFSFSASLYTPSHRLIHPSFLKSARRKLWRWSRYSRITDWPHSLHLWLQNVLGILWFSIHTCFGHKGSNGSLRWGTGLLITLSYRGLIVINSFLSYSSWLCSPSYWSRPLERYRRWMPTREPAGKDWRSPMLFRQDVEGTVQGRLIEENAEPLITYVSPLRNPYWHISWKHNKIERDAELL